MTFLTYQLYGYDEVIKLVINSVSKLVARTVTSGENLVKMEGWYVN